MNGNRLRFLEDMNKSDYFANHMCYFFELNYLGDKMDLEMLYCV